MPYRQSSADRPTGVASRRLDPQSVKGSFSKNSAVSDTVQRNSPRQAEVFGSGLAMQTSHETEHHFFRNFLDRACEIHITLSQFAFRLTRRPAKQMIELTVSHGKSGAIIEKVNV